MVRYSFFRRFVSLLLAVLVLTASVGLTVQRLTCRMNGHTVVSLMVAAVPAPRGCTGPGTAAQLKSDDHCCDFSSHSHKLSAPAHELAAKVLVPVPIFAAWVPALTWHTTTAATVLGTSSPRWYAADSSPPPLGGRGLLTFVCTLVV